MDREYTMQLPQFIIKGEDILSRTKVYEGKYWEEEFKIGEEKIKYKYILLEDKETILPGTYYIVIEVNREREDRYSGTFNIETSLGNICSNYYQKDETIYKSYIKLQPLKNLEEKINAEINLQALSEFKKDLTLGEIAIVTHNITKNYLPLFQNAFNRCNALKRLNEG